MPDFEEAKNFPRDCENLKSFPVSRLGPFCLLVWSQSLISRRYLMK